MYSYVTEYPNPGHPGAVDISTEIRFHLQLTRTGRKMRKIRIAVFWQNFSAFGPWVFLVDKVNFRIEILRLVLKFRHGKYQVVHSQIKLNS